MNFDKHKLFEILTSHPWDSGTGRKMLFLKRRYYVFDDEHKLLDGGVIRYNKTLEKIFIRNEDIRGEVFLSLEGENIHLQGAVYSQLAGQINIDNVLTKYEKSLQAPLSRVAKVERYLRPKDIYEILLSQKEIDQKFLNAYEKSLHGFSAEQAWKLYIKISPSYFKNYEIHILKTISLYFSSAITNDRLYQELFMFLMNIQVAYEKHSIKPYDINLFISKVKDRLLDTYKYKPASIPVNIINEALFYFHIDSPNLPTVFTCINRLYNKNLQTQQEYAYYLSLMDEQVMQVEKDILQRLINFYQEKFFNFKHKLLGEQPQEEKMKKMVTELGTQLALIQALDHCKSDAEDTHIFLLFLLLNNEEKIQEAAEKALINIKEKAEKTFTSLNIKEDFKRL